MKMEMKLNPISYVKRKEDTQDIVEFTSGTFHERQVYLRIRSVKIWKVKAV